jgi:hypothetical protein
MGLRQQAASRRVTTHESTRNRIAVRRRSDRTDGWTHGATTLRRAEICRAIGGGLLDLEDRRSPDPGCIEDHAAHVVPRAEAERRQRQAGIPSGPAVPIAPIRPACLPDPLTLQSQYVRACVLGSRRAWRSAPADGGRCTALSPDRRRPKRTHMSSTLRAARRTVDQLNERGGFCGMSAVPPPVLGFATWSGLRAVADIAYWCVTRGK